MGLGHSAGWFYIYQKGSDALKKMGVKITVDIGGDTSDRLESLTLTGVDLDHKVDLVYAKKVLGDRLCLIEKVNPTDTLVFKSADEVYNEARELISSVGAGNFISPQKTTSWGRGQR